MCLDYLTVHHLTTLLQGILGPRIYDIRISGYPEKEYPPRSSKLILSTYSQIHSEL